MIKVILVAGARPNFMKIAPLLRSLSSYPTIIPILVHTGQHYDEKMSKSFFDDLGIKEPDFNLNVGSGSHAVQTANIMIRFEEICLKEIPKYVVVVGDVNSTIAAGLVAKKLNIPLAHIEAGLRSNDREMPEEINRLATDSISDLLFTTEPEGTNNLLHEGVPQNKIHYVGHVMIDNLLYQNSKITANSHNLKTFDLKRRLKSKYLCVTMHRPSNVDRSEILSPIINALKSLSNSVPILFPCHPRTLKQIREFDLLSNFSEFPSDTSELSSGLYLLEPLGYNDFLYLWKDCAAMLTDSGGLQEETTALKIPCITIRENTERPITVTVGSNVVVGTNPEKIVQLSNAALSGKWKQSSIPDLWDGNASQRIATILHNAIV